MQEFCPQSILVTTDLSPRAAVAYPAARSLAFAYGSTVTLLTCIDLSVQFPESYTLETVNPYVPELVSTSQDRIESDLKADLVTYFPGMAAKHAIRAAPRSAYHTILQFIRDSRVDLVILASHGRTGLPRMLLGSVAEQIVRHAQTPTLVVPVSHAEDTR